MTNDTNRTTDEIERDIARERSEMSDTLNDLQEKFSFDAIVNDLGGMFRDHGGDLARSVSTTVGRNPAAVMMVGVGLAWLFLGPDGQHSSTGSARPSRADRDRPRYRAGTMDWDRIPGPAMAGDPGVVTRDMSADDDHAWYERSVPDHLWDQGRGLARGNVHSKGGMDTVRSRAGSFADRVSDGAHTLGERAGDMRDRLSDGLDSFSEDARARVLSARRAALDARQSSRAALRRGSHAATTFFEDQPLVVGALALAAGAALGSVLPHSRREDDAMGESSDRLFAEAQAVFWEERDRAAAALKASARELASEVRKDVEDAGSDLRDQLPESTSAADAAGERATDAVRRIADSATGKSAPKAPAGT